MGHKVLNSLKLYVLFKTFLDMAYSQRNAIKQVRACACNANFHC